MSANDRQVGGDHYRREYQHWDLMADLSVSYFPAVITKYAERHPKKAGRQDLEKAVHYAQKWTEIVAPFKDFSSSSLNRVSEYAERAGLDRTQTLIFVAALVQKDPVRTRALCEQYLEQSYPLADEADEDPSEEVMRRDLTSEPPQQSFALGDFVYVSERRRGRVVEILSPHVYWVRMPGCAEPRLCSPSELSFVGFVPGTPEDGGHHARAEDAHESRHAPPGFGERIVPRKG